MNLWNNKNNTGKSSNLNKFDTSKIITFPYYKNINTDMTKIFKPSDFKIVNNIPYKFNYSIKNGEGKLKKGRKYWSST